MIETLLIAPIAVPVLGAVLIFLFGKKIRHWAEAVSMVTAAANLGLGILLFHRELELSLPWAGFGIDFLLKLSRFNGFMLLAAGFFVFLIVLYSMTFLKGQAAAARFYAYLLLSVGFVNGVFLADHLVVLLFFWEGLLAMMFGMIALGGKEAYKTAIKSFVILGITDLCLMAGIGLTGHLAGTWVLSKINLPLTPLSSLAFLLLATGALAKAGAMPFHSWIPDAAGDAPMPFMAYMPGAIEKLVGIYFLSKICLNLFQLDPHAWLCTVLMAVGAVTIVFAVKMALIQKEYKKLLSYHAISQVGYMVLGIGTGLPAGIVGGLFHMLNNSLYKSGLFLTAGSVEHRAGTTDLKALGGLRSRMPLTSACFVIFALSISGVPPFNGFFSKELIYDAALERGQIFYLAAVIGSFFTAASFLKLGHAVYFGPLKSENREVKEASWNMVLPMAVIALFCVLFGLWNTLPIRSFFQPVLAGTLPEGRVLGGMPSNWTLVLVTLAVLAASWLNHRFGAARSGSGLGAVDHIHHAPVLSWIYDRAERRRFDPYEWGLFASRVLARGLWGIDRAVDAVYEIVTARSGEFVSRKIRLAQSGNVALYALWSLIGIGLIVLMFMK
jgi:formate hydrogenlyase subunit 3/multisubunit Na+/H+ antiporter MnhD subunit